MNVLKLLLAIAIVAVPSAAQTNAPPKPKQTAIESLGSIESGVFSSQLLGLSISIPETYTVMSTGEADLLADAGADALKQGRSNTRLDEALQRTMRLLVISEHPYGTPGNSVLEIVATKQAKGVTASMSLAANVMVMKGTPFQLKKSYGAVKHGKNAFHVADLEGTVAEIPLKIRMFVIMNRGYSIMISATYQTDRQISDLEKIVATMALSK